MQISQPNWSTHPKSALNLRVFCHCHLQIRRCPYLMRISSTFDDYVLQRNVPVFNRTLSALVLENVKTLSFGIPEDKFVFSRFMLIFGVFIEIFALRAELEHTYSGHTLLLSRKSTESGANTLTKSRWPFCSPVQWCEILTVFVSIWTPHRSKSLKSSHKHRVV